MFAAATNHPQVAIALTHLSSVVSSARNGSAGILMPRSGRGQRVVGRKQRPESVEGVTEGEVATKEEILTDHLDIESCMRILMQQDSMTKLSSLLGIPDHDHWKTSYVSAQTFFENKTGFTESMLETPHMESFTIFLKPEVRKLLSQTLTSDYTIQRRYFQREHQRRKTGLGTTSFQKSKLFEMLSGGHKATDRQSLQRILKDESPEIQDKIKVAFAEGIMSKEPQAKESPMKRVYKFLLTFVLLYALYRLLVTLFSKGVDPTSGGFPGLSQGRFEVNPEEVTVTFDDIKGCDEAKEELADIVEFLRNREKFQAVGAKLPKGVLMVGSPGVGKTLLAKAVAGEAGVPFFHASGSEFDEVFVGTGAKKVRQLFSVAKHRAPSVIFIDEIDSVGAKRTNSQIHPYANQTVNQLLSEMDGFSGSSGVIVIGATNKRENLDQALLRPGRFDMEVNVLPPDAAGREEIFQLYLSKVLADPKLDVKRLGLLSRGMTGADINNIVNQAALRAVLQGRNLVTMDDIEYARDKIIMGPAWKNKKVDEKTNWNTAYHEAGHTLVAYYSKDAMPLHKVTILPRGQSLGHTSMVPEEEMHGQTKAQLLAQIDVAMGGRVGEELIFGKDQVTSGASSDFQMATRIATLMVKKLGMSEKVGQRVHVDSMLDGGTSFVSVNDLSPDMQQLIDSEINRILHESYARATEILKSHHKEHKLLSEALMKYETLDKEEIKLVIEGHPLKRIIPEKTTPEKKPDPEKKKS